jgi:hypothetical protein
MLHRGLCLALAGLCAAAASTADDTPAGVPARFELLREPNLANGVRVAGRSNCLPEIRDEARARWGRVPDAAAR